MKDAPFVVPNDLCFRHELSLDHYTGRTYGGRVMFGHARGDSWEFDMKVGEKWFVFTFY